MSESSLLAKAFSSLIPGVTVVPADTPLPRGRCAGTINVVDLHAAAFCGGDFGSLVPNLVKHERQSDDDDEEAAGCEENAAVKTEVQASQATAKKKTIQVFVKNLSSATIELHVSPEDTVDELKAMVAKRMPAWPIESQNYVFGGKGVACGTYSLSDFNIRDGSIIHVILRAGTAATNAAAAVPPAAAAANTNSEDSGTPQLTQPHNNNNNNSGGNKKKGKTSKKAKKSNSGNKKSKKATRQQQQQQVNASNDDEDDNDQQQQQSSVVAPPVVINNIASPSPAPQAPQQNPVYKLPAEAISHEYNFDFSNLNDNRTGETFVRGGLPYERPCGYQRYALGVEGKYDNGNDDWLMSDGRPGEWAVSYHGVGQDGQQTLAELGYAASLQQGGHQFCRRVYSTPCVLTAERFATRFTDEKGDTYIVLLQNRLDRHRAVTLKTDGGETIFASPEGTVRPYSILIKKVASAPHRRRQRQQEEEDEEDEQQPAVQWLSIDPRTHTEVPYDAAVSAALERAFQAQRDSHPLTIGGNNFTVNFDRSAKEKHRQVNAEGKHRKVVRREG